MFHWTALLPIDLIEARLSDPAEWLGHYLDNAVEEDEEVFAEVVSERLKTVKQNVEKAQEKQKKYYDSKLGAGASFKLNAVVLKKDFLRSKRKGGKLDPKWLGPYRISKLLGKGLYSLTHSQNGHAVKRVNGMHLKMYCVSYSQYSCS